MDDGDGRAYVVPPMNLLLLISALLSALTGVAGAVRAPQVAQAAVGTTEAAVKASPRPSAVASRPVQASPTLASVLVIGPGVTAMVAATAPLWADRRRE